MQIKLSLFATILWTTAGLVCGWQCPKIAHDQVTPIPSTAARTPQELAAVHFQPRVHIGNMCHVYTAVTADGKCSGGLKPTGAPSAGCKDTTKGQIYARWANYNGRFGMMYSLFFPKTNNMPGGGSRYDWETIVIWMDDPALITQPTDPNKPYVWPKITGVACTGARHYRRYNAPLPSWAMDGSTVKIQSANQGLGPQGLDITDKDDGDTLQIVFYDSMPSQAKDAINNWDWDGQWPPFGEDQFAYQLDLAMSGADFN
ncbi:uncharacterized protein PFL1_04834 [Pseudozyma flocculosa PF-1]|uniref:Uncharacterized protein n=2 Tax=Pseudozyma flocculosa TaxID=84751 RepID=A0A5C3F677_9BASI|nr:uncharacterized protein PFL1_04834 [Pseudozyma flocculosa PF-1]EPQ27696.1 hypothetical protein PFL1_04834 [Pseudozyma flocculosa PF-1]SPO39167.1 uncharacterized protein PSFLO_04646 [Pseudozyma flocculosa]